MLSKRRSNSGSRAALFAIFGLPFAIVAGCTYAPWKLTPFRPPTELAHLRLEGRDSATLMVDKIWLEQYDGDHFVKGYVTPQMGVKDTTRSQVIISIRDSDGTELRSIPADFEPRQIPERSRLPHAVGTYKAHIDPLPPSAAIIVVLANDDRTASSRQERR
jgi:hypothetical protein